MKIKIRKEQTDQGLLFFFMGKPSCTLLKSTLPSSLDSPQKPGFKSEICSSVSSTEHGSPRRLHLSAVKWE